MNNISSTIYKAIRNGNWLQIEYTNLQKETTSYWIAIKDIDTSRKRIVADGMKVDTKQLASLNLFVSSIKAANIIDNTYYPVNKRLLQDIENNEYKYSFIFGDTPNIKLLNYYFDCNRLDNPPQKVRYGLIDELNLETINPHSNYLLSQEQFDAIIKNYHLKTKYYTSKNSYETISLSMNVCSVHTKKGLFVLAYKDVLLDVLNRTLSVSSDIILSTEFTIDGEQISIVPFLGEENIFLLEDFEKNSETIKDFIMQNNPEYGGVDDTPYLMGIKRNMVVNLDKTFSSIQAMMTNGTASWPIKAFFGEIKRKPISRKSYPLAFYDDKVNIDQLLAINSAMRYPLTYVQGPPGTGKTQTILNTIVSAFFNNQTVLITSHNNHPMDEVFSSIENMCFGEKIIPFPIVRLGNNSKVRSALYKIRDLYNKVSKLNIFDSTLSGIFQDESEQMSKLTNMLKNYEERRHILEKMDMLDTIASSCDNLALLTDLQMVQKTNLTNMLRNLEDVNNDSIKEYVCRNHYELLKYLYYTSAKRIKLLGSSKYQALYNIIFGSYNSEQKRVLEFNEYLSDTANLKKFLQIFPVVVTTNISSDKLGNAEPSFDLVVMDEASQCNAAVSLIPIVRGRRLMLVGDPQQLKPVILLNPRYNETLRKRYAVTDEYDYINNSIYKTFLAADAVSDDILLRGHYRCHPKLIDFNNKKYYKSRLNICTKDNGENALFFFDCKDNVYKKKNTSLAQAQSIITYIKNHPNEEIGVITPFVNQKNLLRELLDNNQFNNIECGTVHAFQGDEKETILFSLCITNRTAQGTYNWLKNNKELINVATSRAKNKLIVLGDSSAIQHLRDIHEADDLFELYQYIITHGKSSISEVNPDTRALGVTGYDPETEDLFLTRFNHAINSLMKSNRRWITRPDVDAYNLIKEMLSINHLDNITLSDESINLFINQKFDYVAYEKINNTLNPSFAIEITNPNKYFKDSPSEKKRTELCQKIGLNVIKVPLNYARRYNYVKELLESFLKGK